MLFVGAQIGNAGAEFTKSDDTAPFPSEITGLQNAQTFADDTGGAPASFTDQQRKPLSGLIVKPGLNRSAHEVIVLQMSDCVTRDVGGLAGATIETPVAGY